MNKTDTTNQVVNITLVNQKDMANNLDTQRKGNNSTLNKPKGLKATKEDQRLIGLMVNWLDGR